MERDEYDELLRTLVQIARQQQAMLDRHDATLDQHDARLARQDAMNTSLDGLLAHQDAITTRLTGAIEELRVINAGVQTTLARIETLLARILPHGENGRDA